MDARRGIEPSSSNNLSPNPTGSDQEDQAALEAALTELQELQTSTDETQGFGSAV